ncbi:putative 4-hydroxy-3-methylbut-2-enyl diphosphate reductase [Helianthus anomalus]
MASLPFITFPTCKQVYLPDVKLFRCQKPLSIRCSTGDSLITGDDEFDAKVFRHKLTRSDNYNRKGFGHKEETLEIMNQEYTSKS